MVSPPGFRMNCPAGNGSVRRWHERLAADPPLLLFDEPFGALDPVTRHDMQQQFRDLRARYNVASVFVTHDIAEALALGTRIAVLNGGMLEVMVTPQEFFGVKTPMAQAFLETLPGQRSIRHSQNT